MRSVERKEKKFLLDVTAAALLEGRLSAILRPDPHNGARGYAVRSLYFDTLNDRDFFERLDGCDPRRKVRLRVYDASADFCLLEVKQKQGDSQVKRSLPLSRQEGEALVAGDLGVLLRRREPFAAEAHALMSINGYRPAAIVEYNRTAYLGLENRTRITLDRSMRATEAHLDPFDPDLCLYPVFDPFNVVLEVKYNGFLLSYVREVLNSVDKSETAVSKYLLARSVGRDYVL